LAVGVQEEQVDVGALEDLGMVQAEKVLELEDQVKVVLGMVVLDWVQELGLVLVGHWHSLHFPCT